MRNPLLGTICLLGLAGILTLGLWPFHVPANDASWGKESEGLSFHIFGTAISSGMLTFPSADKTIEIQAHARVPDLGTRSLLSLFDPQSGDQVVISQFDADLRIQTFEQKNSLWTTTISRLVGPVFTASPVSIAISAGPKDTRVYIDGVLRDTLEVLPTLHRPLIAKLIVGDCANHGEGWNGEIFGVALYDQELTPSQVGQHYSAWIQKRQPEIASDERTLALYQFKTPGSIVRNLAGREPDLLIPEKYIVVDQDILPPFWKEFSLNPGYWRDIFNNIVGLVPLGFFFYAYFLRMPQVRRPALVTVILGLCVSLTIEIIQGVALPTRESQTTDLITNTFGTWIGTKLYPITEPRLTSILAKLSAAAFGRRIGERVLTEMK